jgi:sulfate/thiosulfate transport system permease protein
VRLGAPRISSVAASAERISRRVSVDGRASTALSVGVISTYLSVIVVLPIAALVWESHKGGLHAFWQVVSSPEAVGALKLTFGAAFVVVGINAVLGTITAWVLVRDDFRGKSLVNSVIDLPFALPTIVAGLTLLALYGPNSPVGIDVAFTRTAIVLALCFVTLPFVIRTVQPVLMELDVEMEEAARSLGADQFTVFRRIVLPNILPGILSGSVLAFARALGEIGSIVLVAGSSLHTEVASVFIFNVIQDGESAQASAVAIVLLGSAFVVLLAIGALRFYVTRYERA